MTFSIHVGETVKVAPHPSEADSESTRCKPLVMDGNLEDRLVSKGDLAACQGETDGPNQYTIHIWDFVRNKFIHSIRLEDFGIKTTTSILFAETRDTADSILCGAVDLQLYFWNAWNGDLLAVVKVPEGPLGRLAAVEEFAIKFDVGEQRDASRYFACKWENGTVVLYGEKEEGGLPTASDKGDYPPDANYMELQRVKGLSVYPPRRLASYVSNT